MNKLTRVSRCDKVENGCVNSTITNYFSNGTNCGMLDKVPSVFMINGSIIFAMQMLGTVLMKKKEVSELIVELEIGAHTPIHCKEDE